MSELKYIDIHTHRDSNKPDVLAIQNMSPSDFLRQKNREHRYFSVGIHPWYINQDIEKELNLLKNAVKDLHVVAVGETGLDKLCDVDFNMQKKVFIHQIELAGRIDKALIIHCVKAWDEVVRLLKEQNLSVPVIFHGFRGKPQLAESLLKNDYYLSFGNLLNEESLQMTPVNRIFIETDEKKFSIKENYKKIAEKLNMTEDELCRKIEDNFNHCFQKQLKINIE